MMSRMFGLVQKFWRIPTCRMVVSCAFAAFLGIAAARTFLGSVAVVEGKSMTPNYPPGTPLYTTAIMTPVDRGDVVLLRDGGDDYAVKRVVGLPREMVQIWRGCVFINKKLLVEPYLPAHTYTFPVERERRGATFVLGDDEYFVMGDNRLNSADSRTYGPVRRKQIKRRVPPPDGFIAAYLGNCTLPNYGKTIVRRLDEPNEALNPF
jgi:signal peptidase I